MGFDPRPDCEHASTTTLLWCYGETSPAHEAHIAGCAACQSTVSEQEVVLGLVRPVLPAEPARRRTRAWPWVAAAAVVLLTATWGLWPADTSAPVAVATVDDFVDMRLDALEVDLDVLTSDPSIL
jgi:hypothetical protein